MMLTSVSSTPSAAKVLAAGGVRHRRAAVALGRSPELGTLVDRAVVFSIARHLLDDRERWLPAMGHLVLEFAGLEIAGLRGSKVC
jgi:hypothetical protein